MTSALVPAIASGGLVGFSHILARSPFRESVCAYRAHRRHSARLYDGSPRHAAVIFAVALDEGPTSAQTLKLGYRATARRFDRCGIRGEPA